MAYSNTTLLGLNQPTTGQESGVWGDDVNNGFTQLVDISVAGTNNITYDGDVTLSVGNGNNSSSYTSTVTTSTSTAIAQYYILNLSGSRAAARSIIAPASSRSFLITNATTVTYTIKKTAGTGVTVAAGETALVYYNTVTADYAKATTSISTSPGGSNTYVQYNSSGSFAGSANHTFDGTTMTLGNAGVSARFQGDFSNATFSTRTAFQTGTTNATTGIYALPNGTSTAASWQATNNSDPTNASKILIATNGSTDVQLVSGINGTGTYLPLTFYTNGAEKMRLDTSGNLGIGTSSPNNIFEASRNQNSETQVRVYNANAGSSARSVFLLGNDSNSGAAGIYLNSSTNTSFGGGNSLNIYQGLSAPITFLTNATERMRLDTSGNLGLGVTPSTWTGALKALQVGTTATIAGGSGELDLYCNAYNNGSNLIYQTSSYASQMQMNNLGQFRWFTAPSGTAGNTISFTQAMTLSAAGGLSVGTTADPGAGAIYATGNITAYYSSDIKFKENVQDIPDALGIVTAIGSKTFDWTDEYLAERGGEDEYFQPKQSFGVIAQDVQKVFPQAVRTREDGSLAVDYEKLAILSFGAIGQLLKRVEALEAK